MDAADIVIQQSHLTAVVGVVDLADDMVHRVTLNLAWAFLYNLVAMPLAGGVLFPLTRAVTIPPGIAGLSELFSSVPVVLGSLLLYRWRATAASGGGGGL